MNKRQLATLAGAVKKAGNLDVLCGALTALDAAVLDEGRTAYDVINLHALPIFGPTPRHTELLWSWDETQVLMYSFSWGLGLRWHLRDRCGDCLEAPCHCLCVCEECDNRPCTCG